MDLIKACKQLVIKDPFYGLFLLSLNKFFTKDTDTACVARRGINYELWVNPDFWATLTDDEQLGLIKHELMHIAFKHLIMGESFSDAELFNIATDAEVNQYIDVIPEGGVDYRKLDETTPPPPKAGSKYYYEFLLARQKKQQMPPMPSPTNHDHWKDFQGLSEAEKTLISNQTDHIVKQVAAQVMKSRGTVPAELQEYVDSLFKVNPPVFNWKAYFRRLIGFAIDVFIKKCHRKVSKRFDGAAGIKMKHKHDILVAIDTSGSVSTQELKDFISEIYHIYKAGAGVDVIECDAQIHRIYPFKGTFDGKFTGRGSTDFKPVIDYYNQSRKQYSTLVFFTDGYAPTDTFKVMKQMIWVITSNGNRNNRYPGYALFIPPSNGSE